MENKQLAIIVLAIIIAACIVGSCVYAGLTNEKINDNKEITNDTNITENKTTSNITEESSPQNYNKASEKSSSSKYEMREAGLFNTETGRYEGGQADGCTQAEVDQYNYEMEQESLWQSQNLASDDYY